MKNLLGTSLVILIYPALYEILEFLTGDIALVSISILVLTLGYLLLRMNTMSKLLNKKIVLLWVTVIGLIPIFLNFIQEIILQNGRLYDYVYNSINTLFNLSILFLGAVFILTNNERFIKRILISILIIILLSFLANIYFPNVFIGMAILQGRVQFENVDSLSRLFGLYIQSNNAALAVLSLIPLLLFTPKIKSIAYYFLLSILLVALVFSTGSRSGIFLATLFFILYSLSLAFRSLRYYHRLSLDSSFATFAVGLGIFAYLVVLVISFAVQNLKTNEQYSDSIRRLEILTSSKKGEGIESDGSFLARLEAQKVYLEKIINNPFGYGNIGKERLFNSGELHHVSHNMYIENTFKYGIVYLFILFYTIAYSFVKVRKTFLRNSMLSTLFVIILLFGVTMSGVLSRRAMLLSLGMVLGYYLKERILLSRRKSVEANFNPISA